MNNVFLYQYRVLSKNKFAWGGRLDKFTILYIRTNKSGYFKHEMYQLFCMR